MIRKLKAFTLVELAIVVVIIGILMLMLIPAINAAYNAANKPAYKPTEYYSCYYCQRQAELISVETVEYQDGVTRNGAIVAEYGCECGAHTTLKNGKLLSAKKPRLEDK